IRREISAQLYELAGSYPAPRDRVSFASDHASISLLGCRVTVCEMSGLPESAERVLLDVDIDFLVTPSSAIGHGYPSESGPWLTPAALVDRLRTRVRTDFVTVARSVEGGFTPLAWGFLAGEVAIRWRGDRSATTALEAYGMVADALRARTAGSLARAHRASR